jgi:large subunit ribosomal protein L13
VKTYVVKESDISREWYVVDAAGQTLGRLASKISQILKGKHKRIFSPRLDVGDYVIVINADKVAVTGQKMENKMYYRYTGYPGNLKEFNLSDMMKRHPTYALKHAVKGMLPKNRLGRRMLGKLKVYAGAEHPHEAQQPKVLEL